MDYEKKALAQFHPEGTTPSPDEPAWPDLETGGGGGATSATSSAASAPAAAAG